MFDTDPPSLADFEAMAAQALATIPGRLRVHLRDVVVRVEDFPSEDTCRDMELDSPFDLLGLYDGVALDQKSIGDSGGVDMIFLYRRPLLDYWCDHGGGLSHLVRHVVIHEVGHHFGFSDADMEALEREAPELETRD